MTKNSGGKKSTVVVPVEGRSQVYAELSILAVVVEIAGYVGMRYM